MRAAAAVGILALTMFAGCAVFDQQKANWQACKADPACYSQANQWKATGELVGGIAGNAIPVPGAAMPAKKVAGWAVFAVAMLVGGRALEAKNKRGK